MFTVIQAIRNHVLFILHYLTSAIFLLKCHLLSSQKKAGVHLTMYPSRKIWINNIVSIIVSKQESAQGDRSYATHPDELGIFPP